MKKFADDYAYDVLTDDTDEYKPKDKDVKELDSEDKDLDFELGEVNSLGKKIKIFTCTYNYFYNFHKN